MESNFITPPKKKHNQKKPQKTNILLHTYNKKFQLSDKYDQ